MIDDEIREVAERIVNKLFEDVVEVVRCKDCKYWEVDTDVGFCTRTEDCGWNADDFCSKGEKKDGLV